MYRDDLTQCDLRDGPELHLGLPAIQEWSAGFSTNENAGPM
jgi:hypothetical protein